MARTILVTGCAGFIGSNFAQEFKKRFPRVLIVGVDDFSTGRRDAVPRGIAFYEGSITDEKLVRRVFKKHRPEYVFHFAARPRVSVSVLHPFETTETNIGGTVALLEASRDFKVKRFIYSSSSSIYGNTKKLPSKESDPPNPQSPYALQKYTGELFCKQFSALYGLDTVSLRYFNVYGPGQYGDAAYSTAIAAWLSSYYFGTSGFLEGDGTQSRGFSYVDDVTEANILAVKFKGKFRGEMFNVAGKERVALKEVKRLIEQHTGNELRLERRSSRLGDVKHTQADVSKARKWFGYKPRTGLEEGLRKTVAWYKNLRKSKK